MARKVKPKFDKKVIVEAFAEMARERNIDKDLLQGILEETLSMLVRKKYSQEANFDIIVNMDKGDIEIYLIRTVVDEVTDPNLEIHVSEANLGAEKFDVGDDFLEEITLDNISDNFGRRLISMAGQTLNQRIRDVEKDNVFKSFADKMGEIIIGEVHQVRRSDVFIMYNGVEMRLPREEQIPHERYRKNDSLRAIVKEVRRQGGPSNSPEIILSRSSNEFLARLFEVEIPEIYDGIIDIKGIAREPGERAKVAVQSYDQRIDPVGACVGMKGIRIHSIVRELSNENIDVVNYSDDPAVLITRALAPAKIKEIQVSPESRSATVLVADEQVSLAIGKSGQNVRLASKLTGYAISLIKEGGEDIELIEFRDEIGRDLYQELIGVGIDTAREFLDADFPLLLSLPGMSKEYLLELRAIMLTEFDEKDNDNVREAVMRIKVPSKEPANEDSIGNVAVEAPATEATEEPNGNVATEVPADNATEEPIQE